MTKCPDCEVPLHMQTVPAKWRKSTSTLCAQDSEELQSDVLIISIISIHHAFHLCCTVAASMPSAKHLVKLFKQCGSLGVSLSYAYSS